MLDKSRIRNGLPVRVIEDEYTSWTPGQRSLLGKEGVISDGDADKHESMPVYYVEFPGHGLTEFHIRKLEEVVPALVKEADKGNTEGTQYIVTATSEDGKVIVKWCNSKRDAFFVVSKICDTNQDCEEIKFDITEVKVIQNILSQETVVIKR